MIYILLTYSYEESLEVAFEKTPWIQGSAIIPREPQLSTPAHQCALTSLSSLLSLSLAPANLFSSVGSPAMILTPAYQWKEVCGIYRAYIPQEEATMTCYEGSWHQCERCGGTHQASSSDARHLTMCIQLVHTPNVVLDLNMSSHNSPRC